MQTSAAIIQFLKRHCISLTKYSLFLVAFAGFLAMLFARDEMTGLNNLMGSSGWMHPAAQVGFVVVLMTASFYIWLGWNTFRYRPIEGVSDELLPRITVVVPAYNEGKLVQETLQSLATGDYPPEKLQLIAVDDGSKDDTWHYIQEAERQFPGQITTVRQPKNGGKRRALYEGFKRATGDVLITVDSDSIVASDTLRNMASPFAVDSDCGAVAGNVRVLNRNAIIPKMLEVSFVFSFEFVRSAQSVLRTVFCTPGALAAYRRDLVLNVLDEWLNQRFLGREANIGEDRALTNLILRQGKSVLFQSNAMVYTNVPNRYKGLCKMFIRWDRSNVRENLKMGTFVFKNFRPHHRISARFLWVVQCMWCMTSPMSFLMLIALVILFPVQFITVSIGGGAIWSSISALFYAHRYHSSEAFWAFGYGVFYFCALAWIAPYALLTVQRTGWLTRDLTEQPVVNPGRYALKRYINLIAMFNK